MAASVQAASRSPGGGEDRIALAVDIGGTKIAAGIVTASGDILERVETPTPAAEGAERILAEAIRIGRHVARGREPVAVGVGTAGVVGADGRVSAATGILTDWTGADVSGAFREAFDVPVSVRNDAHAHAVGEAVAGAGRGKGTVLVVAVGTGIGGAVVVGGMPLLGAHGAAGHLGHVPSAAAVGLTCSCGRDGHLEPLASGPGVHALYRRLGGDPAVVSAKEIADRAATDELAAAALAEAGGALGTVIGGLVDTVDPHVVVIGGGMQHAGDAWWRPMSDAVRLAAMPALAETPIVPAELGADAALIGAAHVALVEAVR
ncbi:ROK family protein [Rathayibacter sp. CAU 1779]